MVYIDNDLINPNLIIKNFIENSVYKEKETQVFDFFNLFLVWKKKYGKYQYNQSDLLTVNNIILLI